MPVREIHAITASHVAFGTLATELGDEVRLVAPDHRDRRRGRVARKLNNAKTSPG